MCEKKKKKKTRRAVLSSSLSTRIATYNRLIGPELNVPYSTMVKQLSTLSISSIASSTYVNKAVTEFLCTALISILIFKKKDLIPPFLARCEFLAVPAEKRTAFPDSSIFECERINQLIL